MTKIYVTKSFMPPLAEYEKYLETIYEKSCLTNQGPLLLEFEQKISSYLDVENFQFVANGTLALQLALNALNVTEGEVITTPFSYVATTSSILWQRCKPVFVDIEQNNFTIDADKIEAAITPQTKAIMAVHVFGYACNIDKIQHIAEKYGLKLIYDGAHAFGAKYKGKSLLDYGDIATVSFHATKLFHTIEGGACIVKNKEVARHLALMKSFGHKADTHIELGINCKASEFNAAMGLANFPYIEKIVADRKRVSDLYDSLLKGAVVRPAKQEGLEYNYAYYPVVFKSEAELLRVFEALNQQDIYPRRYFYPSLNTLPYVEKQSCPISEDISLRTACLPLYVGLQEDVIKQICAIIKEAIK